MAVWDDLVGQDRVAAQLIAAARDAHAYLTAARTPSPGPGTQPRSVPDVADLGDPVSAAAPDAGAFDAAAPDTGFPGTDLGDATAHPDPASGDTPPSDTTGAAVGTAMTHAWLFTGPPGAGRATAARAFAAALQCVGPDQDGHADPGCGFCTGCHTTLIGTHADVEIIRTDLLSIGVKETRELVRRAQLSPAGERWQVIVVEDADRLTEGSGNVLLKAIEEPAPRTVWLLCAPSVDDVLPTIRSRCRHLRLRTPPVDAVAELLVQRDGIEPERAIAAARATGGHIDRARRLATDERARARRAAALKLPLRVADLGGCLKAAQELIDAAAEDSRQLSEEIDAKETEELRAALGAAEGKGGRLPRGTAGVMKELEDRQKSRATRSRRDSLDLALTDLIGFYRDVLARQFGSPIALAGDDVQGAVERIAATSRPEQTLRRMEAVLACRQALDRNVTPLLAVEAMTVALRAG